MKFASTETLTVTGIQICCARFEVDERWNLVGAPMAPVCVALVRTEPESIRTSEFFGYSSSGGYTMADSIRAGSGYWVKTTQAGVLIAQSDPIANTSGWTLPKRLAKDSVRTGKAIVLSNDSSVFVTWNRDFNFLIQGDYTISTDAGCSWTKPRSMEHGGPQTGSAYVFAASSGTWIYLAWTVCDPCPYQQKVEMRRSSDFGKTWFPLQSIQSGSIVGIGAIDDEVYVAYGDDTLQQMVLHSSDHGETFDSPRPGPVLFEGFAASSSGLHGTRSLVVDSTNSYETFYYHSADFGLTWDRSIQLSTTDHYNSNIHDLGAGPKGMVYALWKDGKYGGHMFTGVVIMRRSTDGGQTFGPEQVLSPNNVFRSTIAVQDSLVAVAWDTDDGSFQHSNVHLVVSHDYGATFDTAALDHGELTYTDFPSVAFGNRLFLVESGSSTDYLTRQVFILRSDSTKH